MIQAKDMFVVTFGFTTFSLVNILSNFIMASLAVEKKWNNFFKQNDNRASQGVLPEVQQNSSSTVPYQPRLTSTKQWILLAGAEFNN